MGRVSPNGYTFMVACCAGLGGCPMWVHVHRMRVCLSPPSRLFSRTLLHFLWWTSSFLGWQRVASYVVPWLEYLQHLCYWLLCPQISNFWLMQSTCKPHKSMNLVNMIMSLYDYEFFLHDIVIKHGGNMLFISPFFVVPTCIHPVVAMGHCFELSFPRLHEHPIMEDKIYTLLYHSHFGLHDCKSDHASLNHVGRMSRV